MSSRRTLITGTWARRMLISNYTPDFVRQLFIWPLSCSSMHYIGVKCDGVQIYSVQIYRAVHRVLLLTCCLSGPTKLNSFSTILTWSCKTALKKAAVELTNAIIQMGCTIYRPLKEWSQSKWMDDRWDRRLVSSEVFIPATTSRMVGASSTLGW